MAINFPNSPANGDTHTAAGTTYVYDATNSVWKRQGSSGGFDPASVSESLIPDANETHDLGSSTNKFRDLYLSGNSITLGTVELSDNGGALEVTPTGGGSAEPFATETYVTTQVNNLVDAAPGTLDTLNELAAALGDDAAFSTTVTNSLANKLEASDLNGYATETYVNNQITAAGSYSDASVDSHLNQSTATTDQMLVWDGSDYVWNTPAEKVKIEGGFADMDAANDQGQSPISINLLSSGGSLHINETDTFDNNGNVLYAAGTLIFFQAQSFGSAIYYTLATPWDTSSTWTHIGSPYFRPATGGNYYGTAAADAMPTTWRLSYDGDKAFVLDRQDTQNNSSGAIYIYQSSNINQLIHPSGNGSSYNSAWYQPFNTYTTNEFPLWDFRFSQDGTKIYLTFQSNTGNSDPNEIQRFDLTTPWDLSTASASAVQTLATPTTGHSSARFAISPDGKTGAFRKANVDIIYYTTFSTAFDLTTAGSWSQWPASIDGGNGPADIFFKPDGTKLYIMSDRASYSGKVFQYDIPVSDLIAYATKSYVDTSVANLVDSAPATLDTLNELAAALGDDANFSTTVTNSLANKADTSSLATVATSGSYNDLSNQPTIPTIDTSVTTVSSPTVNLDLNNSNFKIDLNANSTTVTTSNNPSTGFHEYTFEIKGNASQDTHNIQSNPSNAITNWRTAQQSSITGFTVGVSNYNAFAASPDGQYAVVYQAYSGSNKQLTVFKMSTPGDVTTATSHLVISNISVSAGGRTDQLGMRPSIYFLSDNVTINMFGKTYNAETGSNNNNGAGSHSPFYEFSNKGNWTPDGLHFYAPTGDPNFNKIKRWDATAPFDWSTASLVSTTTMTYQSNTVMTYYGPEKAIHVSGDGTKLIAVGKYISNNDSNYAIDTYSLSTPFDPASATYVGQYTVANGGAIHFGSFTNDGNTYMYSDDDRLKSFTNLATTPVLNTITWPNNFYWEGGSAPTATPNDESDIVRFATTDSGSTFNAWVEKDSDKSAGFDGQYSSLTGAPTLATVATSGSYNDLSNQPTIPTNNNQLTNGAGYVTSAQLDGDNTVVSYSSTSSASANDVIMLNTDGTVTPVEVTTFPTTVNGSAPQIVPSSTRLAGSTNDGSVVGDAPNHLFKLDGNKYLSVGRHEGGASNFYGVYSAVAEYNSGSWTWGNVYDMNNTNWGTVNWNGEYYNDPYVLRSPDNPDKFLFFKLRTGGSFAAIIGTVNGLTISWSDYSQPSQNYPSSINNGYNVRTEYDYAGSSAGNYKFIVWYGTSSDMKAFRVVWDGDTTITWEDEVTISTGGSGSVPNGNINPVSASFSRVTEGRLCVHNYTAGSLQVYDIDWVNGTTQVGNNFSITASSSTDGTSNYYGVDVKTAWNPLTDEVISINRLASGNPNIRFRRYNVNTSRTITANGNEFSPSGWYLSSTYWLNGDLKFFPKSNVMFFSHARKDSSLDNSFIHYLSTDSSSSFTEVYGIGAASGAGINWPFAAKMYPDPFSSGQGSMSHTNRSTGVSLLFGKPIQGEYVESNLDKSKIHGLAATSGTTPDVTTQFGVHSGLSGLTVGSKYYVLDDGTLSTTPDTHNAKIGVAVKSTHIALDFIDELTESDLTTYATKSYVATQTFSGSYNDLTNQPTIPANTSQLANNSGFITAASLSGYATETYVNTATANLVDSAPATLDTLNELAAALGDDANFSTTITNQIAAKADAYSIATVTASGGNFYIDGVQQVTLSFEPGRTYRFDQADSSNSSHPLRFSTTSDGTHGSGSEYTTGVTTNGTAGSAGAYVQIAITHATPTLYYYCVNHSGMGAGSVVGNFSGAYSDLTGAPSIPSAYTDSAVDTHLNQSSATTGQLLSWNGSDYTWTDAASGVTTSSTAPSSPSAGDLWFDTDDLIMYVYYNDGSSNQWVEANSAQVGGSSVTNSDTAPSGAAAGDLWFKSDTADLFLYYTDADSSQWVQVGGAGQSTSGSGIQSSIATGNTSVTTTDTGSDGHIDITTEGTARWEVTSAGHILPHANATYDIGSAEKKVRYLFLDSNTMFVGDTSFSEDNIDRSMEVYTDVAAPSSATDIGTKGDVRIVGNHMYVCINTNTWVRTQIETSW